MFQSCKIKLYHGNEWIFVKLGGPRQPPMESIKTKGEFMTWFTKFNFSGQFFIRENSVTKASDPGKFVISNIQYPDAFWSFSLTDQSVSFISRGNWVGGGLKYGETQLQFNPALTLHGAKITSRGVEPVDRSHAGRATVISGGNMPMLRRGSVVSWEWRNWDWPADQG